MSRLRPFSLALVMALGVAYPALAKTEKQFVTDAIKGDNSEVALGQLAITKGGNDQVRSFGQILVNDHTKNRNAAAAVAAKLGVSPPDSMTADAQQEEAKLRKLTGGEFDKEFVQYMVNDHEKDISEFKKEASDGHGPAQQLASQSLPTLEEHLRIARGLEMAK
jgi:putative membrane protein